MALNLPYELFDLVMDDLFEYDHTTGERRLMYRSQLDFFAIRLVCKGFCAAAGDHFSSLVVRKVFHLIPAHLEILQHLAQQPQVAKHIRSRVLPFSTFYELCDPQSPYYTSPGRTIDHTLDLIEAFDKMCLETTWVGPDRMTTMICRVLENLPNLESIEVLDEVADPLFGLATGDKAWLRKCNIPQWGLHWHHFEGISSPRLKETWWEGARASLVVNEALVLTKPLLTKMTLLVNGADATHTCSLKEPPTKSWSGTTPSSRTWKDSLSFKSWRAKKDWEICGTYTQRKATSESGPYENLLEVHVGYPVGWMQLDELLFVRTLGQQPNTRKHIRLDAHHTEYRFFRIFDHFGFVADELFLESNKHSWVRCNFSNSWQFIAQWNVGQYAVNIYALYYPRRMGTSETYRLWNDPNNVELFVWKGPQM
ncbi:uncharacterized protein K452DRAFT_311959 [Aplosporella prunicola CBS 121167]|uniref:Uncharacterized protein n=1 Tax=Aplosporella prunicola CBS 121167 TaxID=1176127 RepID=A0A6A6B4Z8_9PEZI|nr:uncharacterized protein K452DRAFT_311959 [Aplosporella prunicola CBS 121167]KAF2137821.1 hypothetical protein K452DRAFT_311959 [Aplosporella prunicola CBS 121167]